MVPEAVKVMKAAAAQCGLSIAWSEHPIGRLGHELHGHTMPEETVRALQGTDGVGERLILEITETSAMTVPE